MSEERPRWAKSLSEKDYDLALRGVFTTSAAAAYVGRSEAAIRKAIHSGDLKATKFGKGYRTTKPELEAFAGFPAA